MVHAGEPHSSTDRAAELTEARLGKMKVDDQPEKGVRSMFSQLIEAAEVAFISVGDGHADVSLVPKPADNPLPICEETKWYDDS